jgi:hypothetical protein
VGDVEEGHYATWYDPVMLKYVEFVTSASVIVIADPDTCFLTKILFTSVEGTASMFESPAPVLRLPHDTV